MDLPNTRIESRSPALWADSLPADPQGKPNSVQSIPSPGDLPNPGIEPGSSVLQVDSLPTELSEKLKHHKTEYKCPMILHLISHGVGIQTYKIQLFLTSHFGPSLGSNIPRGKELMALRDTAPSK